MVTLERVAATSWGTEYRGSDGERYLLSVVDRQYPGKTKKPVYFLRVWTGSQWRYLSGLFRTTTEDRFSLDVKDRNGVRSLHTLTFREGGAVAELVAGRALAAG